MKAETILATVVRFVKLECAAEYYCDSFRICQVDVSAEARGRRGAMKKTKKKIEFSSHTGNLALMRNYVRRFLESFPFSERQRTLMVLGVDEACTNIIRHAYHRRDDQLISLSLEEKADCVCLRLRDYGKKAAPNSLKSRPADLIKPGGLGLHLIRNAFDQVDYVLRSRGTELVLTKNLDS